MSNSQVVWEKVCLTDSEGVDHYVERGGFMPDWVDEFTVFALTTSGAVQHMAQASAPAVLPEAEEPGGDGGQDDLQKPTSADDKPTWVKYASDPRNPNRISEEQAGSMSKAALMDQFRS